MARPSSLGFSSSCVLPRSPDPTDNVHPTEFKVSVPRGASVWKALLESTALACVRASEWPRFIPRAHMNEKKMGILRIFPVIGPVFTIR